MFFSSYRNGDNNPFLTFLCWDRLVSVFFVYKLDHGFQNLQFLIVIAKYL
jgi:hypothetical protein